MAGVYYRSDADRSITSWAAKVAILGYGSQGTPALNLKESGVDVRGAAGGFVVAGQGHRGRPRVMDVARPRRGPIVIMMLLPDTEIGPIYEADVA